MSRFVRKTLSIVSVVAVAVALLSTSACVDSSTTTTQTPPPSSPPPGTTPPAPTVQPGGDDDRPPVIISSGSVLLRMVARDRGKGKNQDRGEWKQDTGKFFQDHSMQKAKRLFVNVLYGSGGTNCDLPGYNFDVERLEIGYGTGTFTIHLEARDGNGQARLMTSLTSAEAEVDGKLPFWLALKDASAKLASVRFPDLGITCTLDSAKGQVHVYPTNNPQAQ